MNSIGHRHGHLHEQLKLEMRWQYAIIVCDRLTPVLLWRLHLVLGGTSFINLDFGRHSRNLVAPAVLPSVSTTVFGEASLGTLLGLVKTRGLTLWSHWLCAFLLYRGTPLGALPWT